MYVETKHKYIIHITASNNGYCSCEDSFSITLKLIMAMLSVKDHPTYNHEHVYLDVV